MLKEKTKDNKTRVGCADVGCCNPEDFKKMFETKCEYFSGQSDATDFCAMMKNMMGMCCGLKSEGTKMDTESPKKPKGETESTKEECGCS